MIEVRLSNDALVRLATRKDSYGNEGPKVEWFMSQQWWVVEGSGTLINPAHAIAVMGVEL